MNNDNRLKDGDVCMSEAAPFCQAFRARTTLPLADCITSKMFLMNVRHRLQAGDTITMFRFASDTWGEVIQVCKDLVVRLVDNEGVELLKTSEIVDTGQDVEQDISVTRGFRGKFVVRLRGAVMAERATAVEADEVAEMKSNEIGCLAKYYTAAMKKKYGQEEAA